MFACQEAAGGLQLLIPGLSRRTEGQDAQGRVRAQGPKMEPDIILADVVIGNTDESFYIRTGDWFAGACLTACIVLAILGLKFRWGTHPPVSSP